MKTIATVLAAIFLCFLSLSSWAENLDSVLARLRSDSVSERIAALRQLRKTPAEYRAIEPLMNALRDPLPDVRLEALKTWAQAGRSYDATVKQAHRWQKHRSKEQNDAEYEIWRDWQKQILDGIVACAEDVSESVEEEAVRTLAKLGRLTSSQPGYCIGTSAEWLDFENRALSRMVKVIERHPAYLLMLDKEKDWQVASTLSGAIGHVDYPGVYPILRGFLKRSEPEWRRIGCSGLAAKRCVNDLLPLLSDADNRVREQAVFGVAGEREKLLARLAPRFHQSPVPLRRSIAQLIRFEETGAYDWLLTEACKDRNGDVVADTLWVMQHKKSILPDTYKGELADAYARSLLRHSHPRVREEAASMVWEKERRKSLDLLLPLLYDPSKEVQEKTMWLLWEEQDARLPAAYLHAFRRTKTKEVGLVIHILAINWKHSEPLVRRLLSDKDPNCRVIAVHALRDVEHPERMQWLWKAARDTNTEVRAELAHSLREKQDAPTVQLLLTLLEDCDKEVRLNAMRALRGTQNEEALSRLRVLTRSEDEEIRDLAERALSDKDPL